MNLCEVFQCVFSSYALLYSHVFSKHVSLGKFFLSRHGYKAGTENLEFSHELFEHGCSNDL